MDSRNKITQDGYTHLSNKLDNLVKVERPDIISAIASAREHGDLSENAEYHAAKNKQKIIESMISNLSEQVNGSEVVDIAILSGDRIDFGAKVILKDMDSGNNKSYILLGNYETDPDRNIISISSLMSMALVGKKIGDIVEVNAPSGTKEYKIIDIIYGKEVVNEINDAKI